MLPNIEKEKEAKNKRLVSENRVLKTVGTQGRELYWVNNNDTI